MIERQIIFKVKAVYTVSGIPTYTVYKKVRWYGVPVKFTRLSSREWKDKNERLAWRRILPIIISSLLKSNKNGSWDVLKTNIHNIGSIVRVRKI